MLAGFPSPLFFLQLFEMSLIALSVGMTHSVSLSLLYINVLWMRRLEGQERWRTGSEAGATGVEGRVCSPRLIVSLCSFIVVLTLRTLPGPLGPALYSTP